MAKDPCASGQVVGHIGATTRWFTDLGFQLLRDVFLACLHFEFFDCLCCARWLCIWLFIALAAWKILLDSSYRFFILAVASSVEVSSSCWRNCTGLYSFQFHNIHWDRTLGGSFFLWWNRPCLGIAPACTRSGFSLSIEVLALGSLSSSWGQRPCDDIASACTRFRFYANHK